MTRLYATHLLFLVALAGTALVTDSLLIGVVLACLYAAGLRAVSTGWAISQPVEMVLALLILPPSWLYTQYKGDSTLITFQYWMTLLLVVRAWKKLEKRDYFFSMCMAAGIYTQIGKVYSDFPFFFLTLLNVFLAPLALNEVSVRFHANTAVRSPMNRGASHGRGVRMLSLGGVSILLAATMTLVFMALPRGGQPVALLSQDLAARMTGFSAKIELGSFSQIQQNNQIAMRVTTDHPGMWRGSVLDIYERGVWLGSDAQYKWRQIDAQPVRRNDAPVFHHRFHILNLNMVNFQFFTKGDAVAIHRINAPEIIWINDLNGTLGVRLSDVRNTREVEYEVEAQEGEFFGLPELTERRLRSPSGQQRVSETELYLHVPADVTEEVRTLASNLTMGLTNPVDKIQAVESYLRENCTYALTDLDSGNRPPLDYFLFDQKRGHCEYFATTMAMLLRCVGVPTRVVQGFGPGILVDGQHVVRMSDAHLWVDVFYAGQGWKSHDPTPVTALALEAGLGAGSLFDRLQIKWLTHVMDYNGVRQVRIMQTLAGLVIWPIERLRAIQADGKAVGLEMGRWALAVFLSASVGWLILRVWRKGWSFSSRVRRRDDDLPDYFRSYLRILSRHGYDSGHNVTAMELLDRLSTESVPIIAEARLLTDLYLRDRYRADVLSSEELAGARSALAVMRKWRAVPRTP